MEYDKNICPVVNVDGVIERGKQYDLDITLPEDNRNVIYGIVRDCYKDPVKDAVVKLIEVECKMGKDIRKPVSHTFTDENGEFVFGPLCANRLYEVEIWVNNVKHAKICTECHRQGECLKGVRRNGFFRSFYDFNLIPLLYILTFVLYLDENELQLKYEYSHHL